MTIVPREMTRAAAEAILAGERPGDVRVADDYPTEFSTGVAQALGAERQFGSCFLHRSEDALVVGEIGAAFIDEVGTEASEVRRIVVHTPLQPRERSRRGEGGLRDGARDGRCGRGGKHHARQGV